MDEFASDERADELEDEDWMEAAEDQEADGRQVPLPPTEEPPPGVDTDIEDPAAETQGPAPHVRGY